jgi:hypothetical protein
VDGKYMGGGAGRTSSNRNLANHSSFMEILMSGLGFKNITSENWLEPDSILRGFVKLTPQGPEQITPNDLLADILGHQLGESVPREVKALYEVARGSMCYGYFFYPLYTLTYEQLFRVVETAVTLKCRSLSAPASVQSFVKKIEFLIANSIIPESERLSWQGIRGLRNIASHPECQSIVTPGDALHQLRQITAIVNKLFVGA